MAATAFVTPLIRSIRAATKGIDLGHATAHLDSALRRHFGGWRGDTGPTFTAPRRCADAIASKLSVPKKYDNYSPLEYLVQLHPIRRLAHYFGDKAASTTLARLKSGSLPDNAAEP